MKYKIQIANNKLREARKSLGLRQVDVSTALGFNMIDRISKWEKGRAVPSLVNLLRLSTLYNVIPHKLYPELQEEIKREIYHKKMNENIPLKT